MKIDVLRQEGRVIVAVTGRIDNFTSTHFEQDLETLIKTGVKKILLDFSQTTHLGVFAIHFLKKTVTSFKEAGGEMSMRCCSHSEICDKVHAFIDYNDIPQEPCEL